MRNYKKNSMQYNIKMASKKVVSIIFLYNILMLPEGNL